MAGEYEYERQKGSWKGFGVVPCLKLVSVLTSVKSFVTSVAPVEHIDQGCTHLVVGSRAEGIVEACCSPSAASEGTCMARSAWPWLGGQRVEGRRLPV